MVEIIEQIINELEYRVNMPGSNDRADYSSRPDKSFV
jgi:hypothetical protein